MAKPLVVDELWIDRIIGSVNGLEFGTVQIIVHDGRIVQIERTDRKRFDPELGQPRKEQPPATLHIQAGNPDRMLMCL